MRRLHLTIQVDGIRILETLEAPDYLDARAVAEAMLSHVRDLWPDCKNAEVIERHMAKEMTP